MIIGSVLILLYLFYPTRILQTVQRILTTLGYFSLITSSISIGTASERMALTLPEKNGEGEIFSAAESLFATLILPGKHLMNFCFMPLFWEYQMGVNKTEAFCCFVRYS